MSETVVERRGLSPSAATTFDRIETALASIAGEDVTHLVVEWPDYAVLHEDLRRVLSALRVYRAKSPCSIWRHDGFDYCSTHRSHERKHEHETCAKSRKRA